MVVNRQKDSDAGRAGAGRFLRLLDLRCPNQIAGLYIVGSGALGAWRLGGSDIDVIVGTHDQAKLTYGKLVLLRGISGAIEAVAALLHRRPVRSGTVNASFVTEGDLGKPVSTIVPLGSFVGLKVSTNKAFDINPVMWFVLERYGIALRGPNSAQLGLIVDEHERKEWTKANLLAYWKPWAEAVRSKEEFPSMSFDRGLEWGVSGVSRMHCTVRTGNVISKRAALDYASETFDPRWEPVIRLATAQRDGEPNRTREVEKPALVRSTADFVSFVINDALAI
jgi:Domain of unknown function (DUF4111)